MTDTPYTKFTPRGNNLLIRRADPERTTGAIGRIIIPDTVQKPTGRGRVIAAGPGRWSESGNTRIPCECRIGDVVLFPAHLGAELVIDGEKFTLLADDEILAVVE